MVPQLPRREKTKNSDRKLKAEAHKKLSAGIARAVELKLLNAARCPQQAARSPDQNL
jgi:hypothetical protein